MSSLVWVWPASEERKHVLLLWPTPLTATVTKQVLFQMAESSLFSFTPSHLLKPKLGLGLVREWRKKARVSVVTDSVTKRLLSTHWSIGQQSVVTVAVSNMSEEEPGAGCSLRAELLTAEPAPRN